jgi:hypothetical protein
MFKAFSAAAKAASQPSHASFGGSPSKPQPLVGVTDLMCSKACQRDRHRDDDPTIHRLIGAALRRKRRVAERRATREHNPKQEVRNPKANILRRGSTWFGKDVRRPLARLRQMPAGRSSTTRSRSELGFSCDSPCLNNNFLSGFVPQTAGPQSSLNSARLCVLGMSPRGPVSLLHSRVGRCPQPTVSSLST